MTTVEIRDALTKQQALYEQSLKESEEELNKIKNILAEMEGDIEFLKKSGFDLEFLRNVDLERVQKDRTYAETLQGFVDEKIAELKKFLEESLNV